MTMLNELISYVWGYYHPGGGAFAIKGLTHEMVSQACRQYAAMDPDWDDNGLCSDDRLGALNILLSTNPSLKDPYD